MNWKTLIVNLLIALPVLANDFKTANALYDAGRFAEAASAYERLTPKSAGVYFNLGNAWFRQDKLGLAILNYERAQRLAPRDPDILANLKFAQQRLGVVEINQPPQPLRRFWANAVRSRTLVEWSWIEIVTLWLALLAVAGCIWLPKWRTGFIIAAVAVACVWVTATVALIDRVSSPPEAIVLVAKSEARSAPLPLATVLFNLTEGARVAIREDRGEWLFVERADGKQGWVNRAAVAGV
ncbi:MAG: tetratricopeptide repeat protein [Verrucomicrobia bacterium]|nr:tetratricopeptide repeat protein [Verrucomicrobiota bacterium]